MIARGISRRRALTILVGFAGAAGALAIGGPVRGREIHQWQGTALGANAQIMIAGRSAKEAKHLIGLILGEVERLEAIFSLYRDDSELVRLNRLGRLDAPSHDMRVLIARALSYWKRTGGAFNPAIQPLWAFLASHFGATPESEPDPRKIASMLALCDPERVEISESAIRLAPGMALTFNGIGQGYVTDRVAKLLGNEGAEDILLGLGELRALPGRSWQVEIAGTQRAIPLKGRAVATSKGAGSPFTADGRWHHLIDPRSGRAAQTYQSVTVIAENATEADALSTAISVSSLNDPAQMLDAFSSARAILVRADGSLAEVSKMARNSARG